MNENQSEWSQLVAKISILFPAVIAVGIKIAYEAKKRKFSMFNACISLFIGVGMAYIFSPYIQELKFSYGEQSMIIASISIGSEKICELILTKLNNEEWVQKTIKWFFNIKD